MAEIAPLADAISELVHDSETVALERFTHLIPHAAGHGIIRHPPTDTELRALRGLRTKGEA